MKKFGVLLGLISLFGFTEASLAQTEQSALASTPTQVQHYQQLLDQHKFKRLASTVEQDPNFAKDAELLLFKAKAMYLLRQSEALDEWIEPVLKQHPTHAQLHFIAAVNKFNLAQEASIFSAAGYAKDGLQLLQQATRLDPTDFEIQHALIGFYSQAPSIAGGDDEEAAKLAVLMQSKNPVEGTIAKATLLLNDEKVENAEQLINEELAKAPHAVDLLQLKAAILSSKEQDAAAFAVYQQAASLADNPNDKFGSLYQVGRLAAVKQQDPQQGIAALEQYLSFYADSDNRQYAWAKLRLAQIYMQQKNFDQVSALLSQLKQEKSPQEKFSKELKAFEKQFSKVKTS